MRKPNVVKSLQDSLEAEADEWLKKAPRSGEYPAYTDAQLVRHGEGKVSSRSLEEMQEGGEFLQSHATPDYREELDFLIRVSKLTPLEASLVTHWLSGSPLNHFRECQPEIAQRFSRQHLARLRFGALKRVLEGGLTFEQFSRHAVYRKPPQKRLPSIIKACRTCRREFRLSSGLRRVFCSEECRLTARRRSGL